MKLFYFKYLSILIPLVGMWLLGCKKGFLEVKPNTSIVIPETIEDMTQLLDNGSVMTYNAPALGFLSADEYYIPTTEILNSRPTKTERNCYTWQSDIYDGELNIQDWNAPYKSIFQANAVLEQWERLPSSEQTSQKGKFVKAWALFLRSFAFYNLVQIFSPAYESISANTDLGIPLKISANINQVVQRATLQQTYDQIVNDLESSLSLYSNSFPTQNRNRPSKAAANALLARVFLSMGRFGSALSVCDSLLLRYDKLIDYNTLDSTSSGPFSLVNDELILLNVTYPSYATSIAVGFGQSRIDTSLISLYETNDLRRPIFFRVENGSYFMKQGYAGTDSYFPFTGLAVDEIYLIKAECLVRNGNLSEANEALNALLVKRYKVGTYLPFYSNDPGEILNKVLLERRKELVWRGLRWSDIKRLNAEGADISLTRKMGNVNYILKANDSKFVMPIPNDEVSLSHIMQNIR